MFLCGSTSNKNVPIKKSTKNLKKKSGWKKIIGEG